MKNTLTVILVIIICITTLGCKKKKDDDALKYLLLTQSPLSMRFTTPDKSIAVNKFQKIYNKIYSSLFPSVYAETLYAGDAEINAYFDTFYNNIGSLVGTYTPSKFKLPVMGIQMYDYKNYNPNHAIHFSTTRDMSKIKEGDDSWIHIDFTNPVANKWGTIPSGEYNALLLVFSGQYWRSSVQLCNGPCKQVAYTATPEIEVTIPGYGGVFSNYVESREYDITGNLCYGSNGLYACGFLYPEGPITIERIARKNISGDLYSFSWDFLNPSGQGDSDISMDRTKYLTESPIGVFYISGYNAENSIVVSQLSISDLSLYVDSSLSKRMSCRGLVKIPFNGFTVQGSESVTVEVVFDINNIISVYDNSTPADKTDDIVCLSRDWWKRISINVIK